IGVESIVGILTYHGERANARLEPTAGAYGFRDFGAFFTATQRTHNNENNDAPLVDRNLLWSLNTFARSK
ncbi:MAG: hypothetical protein AABY75_07450, partial [Bacteroidota bacterium]